MSIYSSGRKKKKAIRSLYGHLKLCTYEESSALIVKIMEARGLPRKDSGTQETYVKLYILPDPHKLTKQKTRSSKEKDPKFHETFSWILTPEDQEKRLSVSLWTKEKTKHVMVGCMTFQMADILGPDKCIQGWYQLLDDERGMRENVPVPTSITKSEHDESSSVKKMAVTLKRGPKGYGFSVNGFNPVYITRIQPALPAAESGLRVNDIIVEVEGIDVTKASGQVVVEMIRKNPNEITLIIKRGPTRQMVRHTASHSEVVSLTQPTGDSYHSQNLPSHHSTLNLSSNRDAAQLRRTLFHRQQSGGLSPEHSSQDDVLDHSQKSRSSKNLLTQSDLAGSDRSLKESPRKHGSFGRLSSGSSQGSGVQVQGSLNRIASCSYSNTPPVSETEPRSHSTLQPEGSGIGNASGFYTLQRPHRRASYMDEVNDHPSRLTHVSRRLSTDNVVDVSESNGVFTTSGNRARKNSPQSGKSSFQVANSQLQRTSMSQMSSGSVAQSQTHSQATYDTAYSSQNRQSPGASGHHYSATQVHDFGPRERFKSLALSPPGNVQLTAARRVFSDERLAPSLYYGRKLSDNDSALGGSVGDFTPSPLQVGPINPKPITVDYETLNRRDQKRQKAIHDLLSVEYDFEMRLQSGIETFLEPLRSKMQAHNHRMIFMNLEEICEMTQDICNVLRGRRQDYSNESPPLPYFVPSFADVYTSRLRPLKHQFEKYFKLFEQVGLELSLAFRKEDFSAYVKELMDQSTVRQDLYEFVILPKMHIPKLLSQMMLISSLTAAKHEDQKHLSSVIDSLLSCCPDQELVSTHRKKRDTMAALKLRVGFSHNVEKIVIDIPGRSLEQEGEVTLVEKKWKRNKKAWLLLFNDVILITLCDGSIYSVIETPFVLYKMTVHEMGGIEGTDLQFSQPGMSKLIRCTSYASKEQWLSKLEECSCSVVRTVKSLHTKEGVKARRLTDPIDLAEATSLASNFESSSNSHIIEGDTANKRAKGNDRKKRQGLFGIGRQGERPQGSCPPSIKPETVQNGSSHSNPFSSVPIRKLRLWSKSFDALLESAEGRRLFEDFLKSEFSQENLQFWVACEEFKKDSHGNVAAGAKHIYEEFVCDNAPRQVNLDHKTYSNIEVSMKNPKRSSFDEAQHFIYQLMARDSFQRFQKTPQLQQALKCVSESPS